MSTQGKEIRPTFLMVSKITSKCSAGLIQNQQSSKLQKESQTVISPVGIGIDFLDGTPFSQDVKPENDK